MKLKNKLSNENIKNYSPLTSSTKQEKEFDLTRLNDNVEKYAKNLYKLTDILGEINDTIYKIENSITDHDSSSLEEDVPCDPELDNFYNCNEKLDIIIREIISIKTRLENLL